MKHWRRWKTYAGLLVVATTTLLFFQNCGSSAPLNFEDLQSEASAQFFNYPYSNKPQFYLSVSLFRPTGNSDLSQIKLIASAADIADAGATIDYQIKISTPDGQMLCPENSGELLPGQSTIIVDCVSMISAAQMHVVMSVQAGSNQQTLERDF